MRYAHVQDGTITTVGAPPPVLYADGRWWDLRDHTPELLETHGYHPIVETPRPDDTDTTTHDETVQLIDGTPTVVWEPREWTVQERSARARLDSLVARVERIEAHLWPPDPDPDPGEVFPPFAGVWPNGAIITDNGTLWRNISGVPLTTPPSGFPGDPDLWAHLFVTVGDPGDANPPDGVREWSPDATWAAGDLTRRDGIIYRCLIPHGPEYQGTWGPPAAGVWEQA